MKRPARVTIVLGKGGVGRTTVAAALALDWARRGEKVLLASVGSPSEMERRILQEALAGTADARARRDLLKLVELQPKALVDDLVRRVLRLGPLTGAVLRHPGYESFVDIVPGIREMALLHRVFEERAKDWDRIVLDGPATGHGLHFLEAPKRSEAMLVGTLKERAKEVRAFLEDPSAVDLVLVTLPEETPVRETRELSDALRAQGFAVDNVVVNKWLPDVFTDEGTVGILGALNRDRDARERLQRAVARRSRIDVADWLAAVNLVEGHRREAAEHLAGLDGVAAKIALVPHVPRGENRLARVAEALRAGVIR